MSLTADTAGSDIRGDARENGKWYDTDLGVYTYDGSIYTLLDCDDDGYGQDSNWSKVTFSATGGTTYYFKLGHYNGAYYGDGLTPILRFHVEETPPA